MAEVKKGWREIPIGGLITEAGSSVKFKTGDWRTYRPVLHEDKCINCMICWILCPDSSVVVKEGKMVGFDLDFCKGCGICAFECPKEAIEMILER